MRYILLLIIVFLIPATAYSDDILLQSTDMTYLGAFRGPVDPVHGGTLWYTDAPDYGVAFRSARSGAENGSLYATGHLYYSSIFEGAIPSTFSSSSVLSDIPRMTILQGLTPIFGSNRGDLKDCIYNTSNQCDPNPGGSGPNTQYGGLLVAGDKLIATRWDYYAYSGAQTYAWFTHGLDLSVSDSSGPFKPSSNSRIMSGYLTTIPENWRTALGGDTMSGLFEVPIVSATSAYPSATSFYAADLTGTGTVATNMLMYTTCPNYPHDTLGCWTNTTPSNNYTSNSEGFGGAVFPVGSKTLLVFHVHGTGDSCYGEATTNQSLHGQVACGDGGAETCCYDLESTSRGGHSYPYVYQVQAFSADDLAAVKAGTKTHNELMPYAVWSLSFPQSATNHTIAGVAYDPDTQRLFVRQGAADGTAPLYQVFQLDIGITPISGICGSSNGLALSSAPTVNLCSAGTASAVSGTGPWSWTCAGSGGGSTASCSAATTSPTTRINGHINGSLK